MQNSTSLSSDSIARLANVLAETHKPAILNEDMPGQVPPATREEQSSVAARLANLRQQVVSHRAPTGSKRLDATRRAMAAESASEHASAKSIFIGLVLPN